jgi:hypothetical protein
MESPYSVPRPAFGGLIIMIINLFSHREWKPDRPHAEGNKMKKEKGGNLGIDVSVPRL